MAKTSVEFKLAGAHAERLQVGPDATEWRTPVAARERPAREFMPRHWPGLGAAVSARR